MQQINSEASLSVRAAVSFFAIVMLIMEGTAAMAASLTGDWTVMLFSMPMCFTTALVVGLWTGVMAGSNSEARLPARDVSGALNARATTADASAPKTRTYTVATAQPA